VEEKCSFQTIFDQYENRFCAFEEHDAYEFILAMVTHLQTALLLLLENPPYIPDETISTDESVDAEV
jgi:hypothetical protein